MNLRDSTSGALSAATLHEAAGRIGALPSSIGPAFAGARIAGPAFPVASPPGDNLWIHRAVYAAEPGDVLVVDVGGGTEFGYWGEILSTAALARGLAGLVINGGVRDRDALAELGLPVFSAGLCIRGTGKDLDGAGSLGTSVRIGEVFVDRGDLVAGDADGVVVVPQADTQAVLKTAAEREDKEAELMRRIRAGERTLDLYGWQ
ncbi:RraA family protein [Streptomyces spongiae]|uniref:RraA family protein n=1 Tax=Streptomyces spongiae TaxID=565072 RepID=UPI002AD432CF|nr:dimethylmenaquinone methyltransferase [Streptomyces spongiae]